MSKNEKKVSVANFNDLCRSCLAADGDRISIFSEFYDEDSIQLADMLLQCTSIKVEEKDGLPEQMCSQCVVELTNAFRFRRKCQQSEESLKDYLNTHCAEEEEEGVILEYVVMENEEEVTTKETGDTSTAEIITVETGNSEAKDKKEEDVDNIVVKAAAEAEESYDQIECSSADASVDVESLEEFECGDCNEVFISRPALVEHFETVEHIFDDKISCPICFEEIDSLQLVEHLKTHVDEQVVTCKVCTGKFPTQRVYDSHKKIHPTSDAFKCEACEKTFPQECLLKKHVSTHMSPSYVCSICNASFTTAGQINRHMENHALTDKIDGLTYSIICPVCNELFDSRSLLNTHLETAHHKRTYECGVCHRHYSSHAGLLMHERRHEDISKRKQFACNICGKMFSQKCSLKSHNLIHTGEKPFQCSLCDKFFRERYHLIRHIRIHTGERPYSCTYCDKRFGAVDTLKVHLRTHTGETPYGCQICHRRFTDLSTFHKHKKMHQREQLRA